MAMEELLAVQELERRLDADYAAAQAEAKRRIAVEQRACARSLEDNLRNGEVEARRKMAEAERRAGEQTLTAREAEAAERLARGQAVLSMLEQTAQTLARSRAECEQMQASARERLDRAARWIMKEVVNGEWRS